MMIRYSHLTGTLYNEHGKTLRSTTGVRGTRRWREELHVKYPKGKRAGNESKNGGLRIRMRGGPWAGALVRCKERDKKIKGGGKRIGVELDPPDIWFSSEFDGWYERVGDEYRWSNPLREELNESV